jgi:hypothetical protein
MKKEIIKWQVFNKINEILDEYDEYDYKKINDNIMRRRLKSKSNDIEIKNVNIPLLIKIERNDDNNGKINKHSNAIHWIENGNAIKITYPNRIVNGVYMKINEYILIESSENVNRALWMIHIDNIQNNEIYVDRDRDLRLYHTKNNYMKLQNMMNE